jgi:hypothetical protein
MVVETHKQLERIFSDVKTAFPEVNPKLRVLPAKKRRDCLMVADVYETGDVLWKESLLGDYFLEQIRGVIAHEFGHLVNQKYMRMFNQEQVEQDKKRYRYDRGYRNEIERAADTTAVRRGFGKELYFLVYLSSFESGWKKYAQEHLSLREIKELMKKINIS